MRRQQQQHKAKKKGKGPESLSFSSISFYMTEEAGRRMAAGMLLMHGQESQVFPERFLFI